MVSWFPLPLPYTLWFNYSDHLFCFTSHHWKCSFLCQKLPPRPPPPPPHNDLPRSWEKSKWKVRVLVTWLYPTFCNLMDYISPSSSVHGILQTTILLWVAIPFFRGSSLPGGWTWVSRIAVCCLGYQGSPYLCSKHRFGSSCPLCPIFLIISTPQVPNLFYVLSFSLSLSTLCIDSVTMHAALLLLKIYILPKAMPVARDVLMDSTIKAVTIT